MYVFLGVEIVHLNLPKMTLSLSYPETLGSGCAQLYIPSCRHISLPYITIFAIKIVIYEFKPHDCMHHVLIIVIISMLTLCYFIISHATLIIYYQAFMLTLHTSLISCALWLPHV